MWGLRPLAKRPAQLLGALEVYGPQAFMTGYQANGITFSFEERNGVVSEVRAEGRLDDAGATFAGALVGAATGYGEAMAGPVEQFFQTRASELTGQGPTRLNVEEYILELSVTGDAAPYAVDFTLSPNHVSADLFPPSQHTLGPADAKYVIREFSDFQCPACQSFAQDALPQLKQDLLATGDVRFEFHHFPLQSLHANANLAAQAAECVVAANDEAAFWTYHDALFERQQAWASLGDPAPYFVRLAEEVGLNNEGIEACLADGTYEGEVSAAYRAAQELGLRGTPSVFVDGIKLSNAFDPSRYNRAFELADIFSDE